MKRVSENPTPRVKVDEPKNNTPVLIIDDEADTCYLLKGILRNKNIEANIVSTLADAMTHLKNNDPPVIFLDNHLPDGIGMDYIKRLKQDHPTSSIIMITAYDTFPDRQRAYKEGADYFIGKPFTRDIILKTIEKIGMQKGTG